MSAFADRITHQVSRAFDLNLKGEAHDHKNIRIFSGSSKTFEYFKGGEGAFYQSTGTEQTDQQLEAELGVSLFDRTKHSLKLTYAGEVLLSETNELFNKREELLQRVRAAGNVSENDLHLCHMPGALNYHVADVLAQFQSRYPEIDLKLTGSLPIRFFLTY